MFLEYVKLFYKWKPETLPQIVRVCHQREECLIVLVGSELCMQYIHVLGLYCLMEVLYYVMIVVLYAAYACNFTVR